MNGNVIYRIDGVITTPQELAQFQTVSYTPDVMTTKKTDIVTTTTTEVPEEQYPSGMMMVEDPAIGVMA